MIKRPLLKIFALFIIFICISLIVRPLLRPDTQKQLMEQALNHRKTIHEEQKDNSESISTNPFPPERHEDVLDLQEVNSDVVGIIEIPKTGIEYPVLQTSDNDFYMNHDLTKGNDVAGSIFLDYENCLTPMDDQLILYGHHMRNGSMFAALGRYKQDPSFYQTASTILFHTLEHTYVYDVRTGFILDLTAENFPAFHAYPRWNHEFNASIYFDKIKPLATFLDETLTIAPDDQLISLVTCTYDTADARYVLVGKLLENAN